MNKFKKGLIMALAVGVLMMGSVFGATTADFKITTNVLGVTQMGIYSSAATTNAALGTGVATTTIFNSGTGDIDQSLEDTATSAINYLTVRTNSKTAYTVLVNVPHLKDTDTDTETLEYTMTIGAPTSPTGTGTISSYKALSSIASGSTGTLTQFTTKKGLRVESFPFSFSITAADYNNASVGGYEAVITFTLTAE